MKVSQEFIFICRKNKNIGKVNIYIPILNLTCRLIQFYHVFLGSNSSQEESVSMGVYKKSTSVEEASNSTMSCSNYNNISSKLICIYLENGLKDNVVFT